MRTESSVSRSFPLLLIVALLFLVGIGLGRSIGRGPDPAAHPPSALREGVPPSIEQPMGDAEPLSPERSSAPTPRSGERVLRGVVEARDRTPVSGLGLRWSDGGGFAPAPVAETDFLGRFELLVPAGELGSIELVEEGERTRWRRTVEDGVGPLSASFRPIDLAPDSFLRVEVERLHPVLFELRHPDGSIPEGAEVVVGGERHRWRSGRVLRLPAFGEGTGELRSATGGEDELEGWIEVGGRRIPRAISLGEARVERPIPVDLPWPGGIEIAVGSLDGPVEADGFVAALPRGPVPDGLWLRRHGWGSWLEKAGGNDLSRSFSLAASPGSGEGGRGRISWSGVPPGEYLVGIAHRGGAVSALTTVVVGSEVVVVDLDLPPLAGSAVPVRILAPDGGVTPVQLGLRLADLRAVHFPHSSTTDADGTVWIAPGERIASALRGGDEEVLLTITSVDYGVREIPFDGRPLTWRFEEPARVRFEIIDENRAGAVGSGPGSVEVRAEDGSLLGSWWIGSGEELPPLPPGPVECFVRGRGGFDVGERWAPPMRAVLRPGLNELRIRIPVRHSLAVRWSPEDRGRGLTLLSLEHPPLDRLQFASEIRGMVLFFHGLPPGSYALRGERGWHPVTVPADTEVTFDPRPVEALRLSLVRPGDAAARAALDATPLREGDILVEEGGPSISVLQGSHSPALVSLPVLRGGAPIEVETSLRVLRELEEAGLILLPTLP
ncbi:MAG: hypothetical protein ACO4BJ_07050 [Planctomycetota bacterium]